LYDGSIFLLFTKSLITLEKELNLIISSWYDDW